MDKLMLLSHIGGGSLALLCGIFILFRKKGDQVHRRAGLIFYYAMLAICLSGAYMALVKENRFLLLIAVFAFYQNYSGRRAILNRQLQASAADWLVLALAALNTLAMLAGMNLILIFFGLVSAFLVTSQGRLFLKVRRGREIPSNAWLAQHIGMMMGAFIATATAFFVVNVPEGNPLLSWLAWLLPTFVLVPLIVIWSQKYAGRRQGRPV